MPEEGPAPLGLRQCLGPCCGWGMMGLPIPAGLPHQGHEDQVPGGGRSSPCPSRNQEMGLSGVSHAARMWCRPAARPCPRQGLSCFVSLVAGGGTHRHLKDHHPKLCLYRLQGEQECEPSHVLLVWFFVFFCFVCMSTLLWVCLQLVLSVFSLSAFLGFLLWLFFVFLLHPAEKSLDIVLYCGSPGVGHSLYHVSFPVIPEGDFFHWM